MKKIQRYAIDYKSFFRVCFSTLLLVCFFSCDDFVKVDPPRTELPRDVLFNDDSNALAAINGLYSNMISEATGFASGGITFYAGLTADELNDYSYADSDITQFFTNSMNSQNAKNELLWSNAYNYIYHANTILEGLSVSNKLTPNVKSRVKGEAEFARAFVYFYLVNLYGDLPLVLTTDYVANAGLARSSKETIYQQIISDLLSAQMLMSETFDSGDGRIRPNKWAATALLARVYLYTGFWAEAEAQANSVINNTALFGLDSDLDDVFDQDSTEAIWQMKPNFSGFNTWDGFNFIPQLPFTINVTVSDELMEAFESGDRRKDYWVGTLSTASDTIYFPHKYKVRRSYNVEECYMMLRLAEQYLIRAEARAQRGNLTGAIADLNAIRNRAGLQDIDSGIIKQEVLLAIEKERQTELFAEWGHRWFDLNRTKGIMDPLRSRADEVLNTLKGKDWQLTDSLFPIPFRDTQNDRQLKQNAGYY
jgi:hypothetical protein